jgi:integrase
MNLYKKSGSPFWWMDFTVNGERFQKSTKRGHKDKAGATKVMSDLYQQKLNEVQFGAKSEMTLKEAMDRTVRSVEGKTSAIYAGCRDSLLGLGYYDDLGRWALDGSRSMSSLKQRDLTDHRTNRRGETTRRGDLMAANSINIEVRFLRRVYSHCRDDLDVSVPPKLKFVQLEPFEKTRYLSWPEEAEVLRRLEHSPLGREAYHKAKDLYVLLVDTGISLMEGVHLRWQQCDLMKMQIEIRRIKTGVSCLTPISNRVWEILKRRHNQPSPFLEMTRAVRVLREVISEVCNTDEREVEERGAATIHSLRDTFATRQLALGMTLHEIAKIIGHTNTTMTRKYAHLETASVVDRARANLNSGVPT